MRWLVGDVQGCARELEDLLRRVKFDPSRDRLYCLGDLINRGPDSLAAARLWRDVGGAGVIGNHEVYALLSQSGRRAKKRDTLEAMRRAPDGEELFARLRALPALQLLRGERPAPDVWIVHAGLHPVWQRDLAGWATRINERPHDDDWLESAEVAFATEVRCCDAVGRRIKHSGAPERCPAPYRPWDAYYAAPALVVHGHWAWRGHYRQGRVIGLDSGCVYGGLLTAYCPDEDRVVQVPSRARKPTGPYQRA